MSPYRRVWRITRARCKKISICDRDTLVVVVFGKMDMNIIVFAQAIELDRGVQLYVKCHLVVVVNEEPRAGRCRWRLS
jgi:hypothetical protein